MGTRLLTGLDGGPTEERGGGAGKGPPYMHLRALPQEQLGGAVPDQSLPCFVRSCPNRVGPASYSHTGKRATCCIRGYLATVCVICAPYAGQLSSKNVIAGGPGRTTFRLEGALAAFASVNGPLGAMLY